MEDLQAEDKLVHTSGLHGSSSQEFITRATAGRWAAMVEFQRAIWRVSGEILQTSI
jgi:hypothetical protein